MNSFVIAGTNSNCGKTLVATALMKYYQNEFKIIPFKIGPDYIDPMFHKKILRTPSYNLDFPICGDNLDYLFNSKISQKESMVILEGVMGLFNGETNKDILNNGSTFHIAYHFKIPVILLVDYQKYPDPNSLEIILKKAIKLNKPIEGIILNKVKSEKEYLSYLKKIDQKFKKKILGFIPYRVEYNLNSRHLGLFNPNEIEDLETKIKLLISDLKTNINLELLKEISKIPDQNKSIKNPFSKWENKFTNLTIGIAYDEAFNFYYQDNFNLLNYLGVKLVNFSPLRSSALPKNLSALYIGGGYPELYLNQLEDNFSIRKEINQKLNAGLPCLAECGGLLYLTTSIRNKNKKANMVGLFKVKSYLSNSLQHFGYNNISINNYFQNKIKLKSHEFHYANIIELESLPHNIRVTKNEKTWFDGLTKKRTIASFQHIHFYSQFEGSPFIIEFLKSIL